MKVILDEQVYDEIWRRFNDEFEFNSSLKNGNVPFKIKRKYVIYKLPDKSWSRDEECVVNDIFKQMGNEDIFAMDWQHDCFVFNPHEDIPLYTEWYDEMRDVQVYFPSYYPDGDWHFFVDKDFTYGILGIPFRWEMYVFGERLMDLFKETKRKAGGIYILMEYRFLNICDIQEFLDIDTEDILCVVYRNDDFGIDNIHFRHIDIELVYGECLEFNEKDDLYGEIFERCNLSNVAFKEEVVLYQK